MNQPLCLVVTDRVGRVREIPLPAGELLIGRKQDNHVILTGEDVSPHHAKISLDGDHVTLMDLASTTGTFVNARRILRREISTTDRITVGAFELRVAEVAARAEAPARAGAGEFFGEASGETTTPMDFSKLREAMAASARTESKADRKDDSKDEKSTVKLKRSAIEAAMAAGAPQPGAAKSVPVDQSQEWPGARSAAPAGAGEDQPLAAARTLDDAGAVSLPGDDLLIVDDDLGTDRRPALTVRPMTPRPTPTAPMEVPRRPTAPLTAIATATTPRAATPTVGFTSGVPRAGPRPTPVEGLPVAPAARAPSPAAGVVGPAPARAPSPAAGVVAPPPARSPSAALAAATTSPARGASPPGGVVASTPAPASMPGGSAKPRTDQPHAPAKAASARAGQLWFQQIEVLDVPGAAHASTTPRVEDEAYLRLLFRLAEVLRAADSPDQACERSFGLLWETVPADVGVLFLVGDAGAPAPIVVCSKVKIPLGEIPVSRTVVDRVLRDKVAMRCDDIRDDSRFRAGSSLFLYNVRSVIAVPLLAGPTVLGVVYLHRGPGSSFETRDLDVVVAVAHMTALALERFRGGGDTRRRELLHATVSAHVSGAAADPIVERLGGSGKPGRFAVEPAPFVALCAGERGPAALARALQEDELAAYYGELHHLLREAARAEGGIIASDGPDVLLALFPLEAGAEHGGRAAALAAIRAGVAMRSACAGRLRRIAGAGLGIGLDTGHVDTGFVQAGERIHYVAQGPPLGIARDLQRRAAAGDILLTAATEAALEGAVALQALPVEGGVGGGARRLFSVISGTVV